MKEKINYNTSKIYKLCLKQGIEKKEDYKDYIGSTIQKLTQRLAGHKAAYKAYLKDNNKGYTSSYKLFQEYDIDNIIIILIEDYKDCKSKEELLKKERFYIEQYETVNKNIPFKTEEEIKVFEGALRRRQLRLVLAKKMKAEDATELKALFTT